jgi:Fe-S cluster assembly protein SufD
MVANVVCHYRLGAASQLSLVDVQEAGSRTLTFAHAEARVARDAALRHFGGIFGASLAKSRVEARMTGPGAEAQLDGAYVAGETRHVDVRTVQRHVSPNTQSRAFYKGAVAQEGRSIYQGLIEVAEGARQTDAYLTNRNLVLNDGARADSIPSLQIKNNDVRCSHGSTTGKIDPAQLFYLTARGLSPRDARSMLINGYFADVIRRAPTVARERLLALVDAHIIDDEGDQDS